MGQWGMVSLSEDRRRRDIEYLAILAQIRYIFPKYEISSSPSGRLLITIENYLRA